MPGNLKSPDLFGPGRANGDLTRSNPQADPHFMPAPEEERDHTPSGLTTAGGKIAARPQDLSGTLPPCPQRQSPFMPRSRQ
jgi:hypothetical protein